MKRSPHHLYVLVYPRCYPCGTNFTLILPAGAMRSGGAAAAVAAAAVAVAMAMAAAVAIVVAVDAVVVEAAPVTGRRRGGRNRGEAGRARQRASPAAATTESPRPRWALRRWRQLAAAKWQQ